VIFASIFFSTIKTSVRAKIAIRSAQGIKLNFFQTIVVIDFGISSRKQLENITSHGESFQNSLIRLWPDSEPIYSLRFRLHCVSTRQAARRSRKVWEGFLSDFPG